MAASAKPQGGAMSTATFSIRYEIDITLRVDQIWPDGDAPENPTIADVHDIIEQCGGIERVICDWNLGDGAEVIVEQWCT